MVALAEMVGKRCLFSLGAERRLRRLRSGIGPNACRPANSLYFVQ
jgi:hypothetical protein